MKELTMHEMEEVNGGIAPVVVVRVVIALIAVAASSKAN